jgi:hypothetical protein
MHPFRPGQVYELAMYIPHPLSEREVLDAIEAVVAYLSRREYVPGLDPDDQAQQVRLFACEALPRYDPRPGPDGRPTRPLANFLCVVCKNRLLNLRRSSYRRADPPCRRCHDGDPCGPSGKPCDRYVAWAERNDRKARVARPLALERAHADEPRFCVAGTAEEDAQTAELLARIDEHLALELRPFWLRMRAGQKVPKSRRLAVERALREILAA